MEAAPLPTIQKYQENTRAALGMKTGGKISKKPTAQQHLQKKRATIGITKKTTTKKTRLVSVLPADSVPVSEYGLTWHVDAHPSMVPWGTGARPASMSPKNYVRCMAERYPLEQFAHNVGFNFDAFNQITRHDVNLHAALILKQTPGLAKKINRLTSKHVQFTYALHLRRYHI